MNDKPFDGKIYSTRIYNRPLTSEEILYEYEKGMKENSIGALIIAILIVIFVVYCIGSMLVRNMI